MSQKLGVLIMMNNYFHDVATALLLASGVAIWVMFRKYEDHNTPEVKEYFLRIYRGITHLAQFSLAWIILGGIPRTIFYKDFEWANAVGKNQVPAIPRTIFYKDFEWANAVGKNQVPALIVKHILAFIIVGTGAYVWLKLSKRMKNIKGTSTL
jgi:hypothetical protein